MTREDGCEPENARTRQNLVSLDGTHGRDWDLLQPFTVSVSYVNMHLAQELEKLKREVRHEMEGKAAVLCNRGANMCPATTLITLRSAALALCLPAKSYTRFLFGPTLT